jgi:NAD(P)-dependent dehydrogenase (short-subunit alcohol dehydrogenase family)
MRLHGKAVLVTGGASGIGAAVAKRLAAEGARVVAADLVSPGASPEGDFALPEPGGIAALRMDVADEASVTAGFARLDALDGLFHGAGIAQDVPFLDTPVELFDRMIAVNLRGTFLVGQAAARLMRKRGGAIVNVASVSGMRGNVGRSAYGASKGGVVLLSQVMAVDLAAENIRVNVIAPGPIETPMVTAVHAPAMRAVWESHVPMRRYGTPEEVANAALFLLSDESSYMTGHVLAVDGGFLGSGVPHREARGPA